MSDDLISRKEVLELLYEIKDDNSIPKNYGTILDIIREVRMMPTAFDKEKVMNEIKEYKEDSEKWSKKSIENADEFWTYADAYKRCLEIVEKGTCL